LIVPPWIGEPAQELVARVQLPVMRFVRTSDTDPQAQPSRTGETPAAFRLTAAKRLIAAIDSRPEVPSGQSACQLPTSTLSSSGASVSRRLQVVVAAAPERFTLMLPVQVPVRIPRLLGAVGLSSSPLHETSDNARHEARTRVAVLRRRGMERIIPAVHFRAP